MNWVANNLGCETLSRAELLGADEGFVATVFWSVARDWFREHQWPRSAHLGMQILAEQVLN